MSSIRKEICVAVIGTGGVGSVFVNQLANLHKTFPVCIRLIYIAMIDKALYDPDYKPMDISTAVDTMESQGLTPPSFSQLIEYLKGAPSRVVVADNTSSQGLAETYPEFLRHGISIITPNKKAFSGTYELWESIMNAAQAGNSFVFHESSVGAGMPILSTLNEMVMTGDKITRIEGVFSGTMSYLFNNYSSVGGTDGCNWSAVVTKAKALGYTEPDPRDDLNGLDVARKVTILARIAGCAIASPTSFPVESLIPPQLATAKSGDEFLQQLPDYDQQMKARKEEAERQGKVLRYIGSVDIASGKAKAGIQMLDKSHPVAGLEGSDNLISFYTERYGELPLTIRGAGAGGHVTAMGVTGDLLKIVKQIK